MGHCRARGLTKFEYDTRIARGECALDVGPDECLGEKGLMQRRATV